jgi:hypothetical protein
MAKAAKKRAKPPKRGKRGLGTAPAKKPIKKKKKKKSNRNAGTCFVLMPFREPFDTYYEAIIMPAVKAAHLVPLRGDSLFRPTPIMADIWQMIQKAKVLLAEFTTKNANVFYELGLAHAIGKPVVLMSETIEDVPFDLQPLRVILYNKNDPAWGNKLKDSISTSLQETLSDPSEAVPAMFRKVVKSQAPEESGANRRVADLERRVAALANATSLFDGPRSSSPLERLEKELNVVKSHGDAIAVAREALLRGMPPLFVETLLRRRFSTREVAAIMKVAGI